MNFIAGVLLTILARNVNRWKLILLGMAIMTVTLLIIYLGILFEIGFLVCVGMLLFMLFFGLSLGGSLGPYLADIVP